MGGGKVLIAKGLRTDSALRKSFRIRRSKRVPEVQIPKELREGMPGSADFKGLRDENAGDGDECRPVVRAWEEQHFLSHPRYPCSTHTALPVPESPTQVNAQARCFPRSGFGSVLRSVVPGSGGGRGARGVFVDRVDGILDRSGIRKTDTFAEHVLPLLKRIVKLEFFCDARDGVQEELAEIGEGGGFARRDAILGSGGKELAEDEINVSSGEEIAGDRAGDFRAELMGFAELLFGAGVEGAERVVFAAEHAAAAAVGERELAEGRIKLRRKCVGVLASVAFSGHKSLGE